MSMFRMLILVILLSSIPSAVDLGQGSAVPGLVRHKFNDVKQTPSNGNNIAIAAWERVDLEDAAVTSRKGAAKIEDCTRVGIPQTEVDCFSVQQNFWISNSAGKMLLWAQNVVQLAELRQGVFFATFVFIVWNFSDPFTPFFCEPYSISQTQCRAPIYTDPAPFPRSITFYSYISSNGNNSSLHLWNDFGSRNWNIPPSVGCPCFLNTVRQAPPPWGYFPFESVVVGVDSSATGVFRNGTRGSVGPGFVQLTDGTWHQVTFDAFYCLIAIDCPTPTATGEDSRHLKWINGTGQFYWSEGAYYQGVYIASISGQPSLTPPLIHPVMETHLYISLALGDAAFLSVIDGQGRITGYNASAGEYVETIPNSHLTLSGEQGILILDPHGSYHLLLTPTASGRFRLFISKSSNVNGTRSVQQLIGTILAWEPRHFVIDADSMNLTPEDNPYLLILIAAVAIACLTVALLLVRFRVRRRKASQLVFNANAHRIS
jgi:hypothetical protein